MCNGDSGGPLIKDNLQYGVNSYVFATCGRYPSVDTSTAYFIDWITANSQYDADSQDFWIPGDYVPPPNACNSLTCSHSCAVDAETNTAFCTCPMHETIDVEVS